MTPNFNYEQKFWQQSKLVVGIDEVGRGPLAGPVVAGAVIFTPNHQMIAGVNDSKKLTSKKRLELDELIRKEAFAWAIGIGTVNDINKFGIIGALILAINQIIKKLNSADHYLIDGLPLKPSNHLTIKPSQIEYIVKGDSKSYSIAAASIIAKVYRDELMKKLSLEFPAYGWERNMGYGTKQHQEAIVSNGVTIHHRDLFIRKITNGR